MVKNITKEKQMSERMLEVFEQIVLRIECEEYCRVLSWTHESLQIIQMILHWSQSQKIN